MLTIDSINPKLLKAEYAVRGLLVQKAEELEKSGRDIIYCNIGNPQSLGQMPLTYIRQVLALLELPELLNDSNVTKLFPKDIIDRAKFILEKHPHGTGAYTQSAGIYFIREAIAKFIKSRDGIDTNPDHIFLTDGASKGVQSIIYALLAKENDGIMVPVPQYPLYSATISLYGGHKIDYYLDDKNQWTLNIQDLEESITKAREQGINPVAITVINPGNPTGTVLDEECIRNVIKFAKANNLSILADEVYQENVYLEGAKFHSFSKVMQDLGETEVPLFSFHSVSKGFLGECGHRGGYIEFRNIPQNVLDQLLKLQSISLCSNVSGQLVTYLMISPPRAGDESYNQYIEEKSTILNSLASRAAILSEGLNKIEGVSLYHPQGAMYAFVRVEIPHHKDTDLSKMSETERASYHAKRNVEYCLALLEKTGICVVPGSGFGQKEGTYHFRTTFLPPMEQIEAFVREFEEFHKEYVKRFR
jgi:aspartate/methionine/tyrosine aminotransferase